jgi:hypothetical protein
MQRITRYPLLIKQILHYTPKDHADHADLLTALSLMETLLSDVNAAAKDSENEAKMKEISSLIDLETVHLDLTGMTRHLGKREYLHEGTLYKAKSGRKLHVFLFNDLILLCEPTNAARGSGRNTYTVYRQVID